MNNTISSINLKQNYLSFGQKTQNNEFVNDNKGAVAVSNRMSNDTAKAVKAIAVAALMLPAAVFAKGSVSQPNQSAGQTCTCNQTYDLNGKTTYVKGVMSRLNPEQKQQVVKNMQELTDTLGNSNLSDEEKISQVTENLKSVKNLLSPNSKLNPARLLASNSKKALFSKLLGFFAFVAGFTLSAKGVYSHNEDKELQEKRLKTAAIAIASGLVLIVSGFAIDKNTDNSKLEKVATVLVNAYNNMERQYKEIPETAEKKPFNVYYQEVCMELLTDLNLIN